MRVPRSSKPGKLANVHEEVLRGSPRHPLTGTVAGSRNPAGRNTYAVYYAIVLHECNCISEFFSRSPQAGLPGELPTVSRNRGGTQSQGNRITFRFNLRNRGSVPTSPAIRRGVTNTTSLCRAGTMRRLRTDNGNSLASSGTMGAFRASVLLFARLRRGRGTRFNASWTAVAALRVNSSQHEDNTSGCGKKSKKQSDFSRFSDEFMKET